MARTNASLIDGIIEVDSDVSLDPFISIANEIVTEVCADSGYTDERLTIIETWLSSHFYKLRDQSIDTEKAGDVSVKYQYKLGLGLNQTKQGQGAMIVDTAGNLASLSKRMEQGESPNVSFFWTGEDYTTATEGD